MTKEAEEAIERLKCLREAWDLHGVYLDTPAGVMDQLETDVDLVLAALSTERQAREATQYLLADRSTELDWERSARQAADKEVARLRLALAKQNEEISQTLGKALGYAWFKDDPKNFPDATEAEGVCVGEHIAESLADEAAKRLLAAGKEVERLKTSLTWVTQVQPAHLNGGAYVSMTWDEFNAMRAAIGKAPSAYRGKEAKAATNALNMELRIKLETANAALSALPPPVPAEEAEPVDLADLERTLRMCEAGRGHNPGMISIGVEKFRALLSRAQAPQDVAPTKRTMTINLTDEEMAALEKMAAEQALKPQTVFRQALRVYQLYSLPEGHPERIARSPTYGADRLAVPSQCPGCDLPADMVGGCGSPNCYWKANCQAQDVGRHALAAFQSRQEGK